MLQSEDIDDDYFTPASSTSLANIFGKAQQAENETLKYTPPKPVQPTVKLEEQKTTQCIYACALRAYEWSNGAYICRGNLGIAILKLLETNIHLIVLYDSNKVTLSRATINNDFEITVKENVYMSYVDNNKKYWSVQATEENIKKIASLLESLGVKLKYSLEVMNGMEKKSQVDVIDHKADSENNDKESDTDSSNRNEKTKLSIISRMANMGQSVLPHPKLNKEQSSDSSDTNDSYNKTARHKTSKNLVKRFYPEKTVTESQAIVETKKIIYPSSEPSATSVFSSLQSQLLPVSNSNIITSTCSGNEIGFLMTEQRVNNSELRINMTRISDKVDLVLDKMSQIENKDNNTVNMSSQVDILHKLLREYDNKIKIYEDILHRNNLSKNSDNTIVSQQFEQDKEKQELKDKVQHLEHECQVKDIEIDSLTTKLILSQSQLNATQKSNEILSNEIKDLNQQITENCGEVSNAVKNCEDKCIETYETNEQTNIRNKIKDIMNNTYHAIESKFDDEKSYIGRDIKSVAGAVIKKVTIQILKS